jgi:hypothetical protein
VTKQLEDFEFEATCRAVAEVARHASPDAHADHEFPSMTQALSWVSQSPPIAGTHVEVDGKRYAVWEDARGKLQLIPSPSAKELEGPLEPSDV